jgi:hypothetical protein
MIPDWIMAMMPWRRWLVPIASILAVMAVVWQTWRVDHWHNLYQILQTDHQHLQQDWQDALIAHQQEQDRLQREIAALTQYQVANQAARRDYQKIRETLAHDAPQTPTPASAGLVAVRERLRTRLQEPAPH